MKSFITLVTTATVVGILALANPASAVTPSFFPVGTTAATMADETLPDNGKTKIVSDNHHALVSFWGENHNDDFALKTSTSSDGGATWSSPFALVANSSDVIEWDAVASGDGTISVAWIGSDSFGPLILTRESTLSSRTSAGSPGDEWSSLPGGITMSVGSAVDPYFVGGPGNEGMSNLSFASNSTGTIAMTWREFTRVGSDPALQYILARVYYPGTGWTDPQIVSFEMGLNPLEQLDTPAVAVSPDGTVMFVWSASGVRTSAYSRTKLPTVNGAWSAEAQNFGPEFATVNNLGVIAMGTSDFIAYWTSTDERLHTQVFKSAPPSPATPGWTGPPVTVSNQLADSPQMVSDSTGRLTLVWTNPDGYFIQASTSDDAGEHWTNPSGSSLSGGLFESMRPRIVIDSCDNVTALWESFDPQAIDGPWTIYSSRLPASGTSPDGWVTEAISTTSSSTVVTSQRASAAVSPDGRVNVIWDESSTWTLTVAQTQWSIGFASSQPSTCATNDSGDNGSHDDELGAGAGSDGGDQSTFTELAHTGGNSTAFTTGMVALFLITGLVTMLVSRRGQKLASLGRATK
jgi:hypothetical protein